MGPMVVGLAGVLVRSSWWGYGQRSCSSSRGSWEAASEGGSGSGVDGGGGGDWPWRSRRYPSREEGEGRKEDVSIQEYDDVDAL